MRAKALKKVISYKIVDIVLHLTIFYIFTRNVFITGLMEVATQISCTIWYYIHEKIYKKIWRNANEGDSKRVGKVD